MPTKQTENIIAIGILLGIFFCGMAAGFVAYGQSDSRKLKMAQFEKQQAAIHYYEMEIAKAAARR